METVELSGSKKNLDEIEFVAWRKGHVSVNEKIEISVSNSSYLYRIIIIMELASERPWRRTPKARFAYGVWDFVMHLVQWIWKECIGSVLLVHDPVNYKGMTTNRCFFGWSLSNLLFHQILSSAPRLADSPDFLFPNNTISQLVRDW